MRKAISRVAYLFAFGLTVLTSCKKDDVPAPAPLPTGNYAVKVRAAVTVGDVVYDSIPATATITSWDRSGTQHQREVQLAAGTNTVHLPKAHTKYRIRMTKWGAAAEQTIMSSDLSEGTTYVIGAIKAAKRLSQEVIYRHQDGSYQLYSKMVYNYDNGGRLKEIENYFIDNTAPVPHLSLHSVDRFTYTANRITRVESIDKLEPGETVQGYNNFTYNTDGKLVGIQYGSPVEVSSARIEYGQEEAYERVRIAYYDADNIARGSLMELKFRGGNRVEEKSIIPGYQPATRWYTFDDGINPYVHMKWPGIDFVRQSKNNVVEQQLDFAAVSMKNEYTYDAEGYATQVVRTQVTPTETRPVFKSVYTY